jgi:hypothetical protein
VPRLWLRLLEAQVLEAELGKLRSDRHALEHEVALVVVVMVVAAAVAGAILFGVTILVFEVTIGI